MHLKSLELTNFKNYSDLKVDFNDHSPIILIGMNGMGKTNFLQAMVILALSKSFQALPLKEFVNWNSEAQLQGLPDFFRIKGTVVTDEKTKELEVVCGKTRKYPKTLKIDGLKMKPKQYIGNLRIVLFTPQDLNIIYLSPQLRRRYVNLLISQIDPDYLEHLSQYQVFIKHRNKLLQAIQEQKTGADQLDYWDEKLAEHGSYLLWKRREVFNQLNEELSQHYESISSEQVKLEINWSKDWPAAGLDEFRENFQGYLLEKRPVDISIGNSCFGPHREDFSFSMNDRDLADSGSRGECRSAILALKLTELSFIKKITNDSPVVLFDDVFSELDESRQKNLLNLFEADQVFITSTHLDFQPENGVLWEVSDGNILSSKSANLSE